jgi:hypothetical protein
MPVDHQLWSNCHDRWSVRLGALALVGGIMLTAASAMAQPQAAAESPPPVEILRGSVAPPAPRIEPEAGNDERLVIAGERLWLVDEAGGRLTGCRLINTIDVGRQAIRCTERRLPKGRPVRD